MNLIYLFFCLLPVLVSALECPPAEVFSPCSCLSKFAERHILCNENVDLKSTFKSISKNLKKPEDKRYQTLQITGTNITEIGANATSDIIFTRITIRNAHSLRRIHQDAFLGTAEFVEWLNLDKLESYSSGLKPYSLFELINSFENVENVDLHLNMDRIPKEAFRQSRVNHLTIRQLGGANTRLLIDSRTFYHLDNLLILGLNSVQLNDKLPADAFQFKGNQTHVLYLNVRGNKLNSSSFATRWLNNLNRPARVDLGNNRISYLDKTVFKSFFDAHKNHQISDLANNPLNCSDCRNAWLSKEQVKYKRRVYKAFCNGVWQGEKIFEKKFNHCS